MINASQRNDGTWYLTKGQNMMIVEVATKEAAIEAYELFEAYMSGADIYVRKLPDDRRVFKKLPVDSIKELRWQ